MKEAQWRINAINERHGRENQFLASLHGRELKSSPESIVQVSLSKKESDAILAASQRRMNG